MTDVQAGDAAAETSAAPLTDLRLEAVIIPVADVERAKSFYQGLGWRLDAEGGGGGFRLVQLTPPGSPASILFGEGVTGAEPGSVDRLLLAVDDIVAARESLIARGAEVGEVFHEAAGGPIGGFHPEDEAHAPGRDPEGRSYASYASFSDPDGNRWMLQEITERLPGR